MPRGGRLATMIVCLGVYPLRSLLLSVLAVGLSAVVLPTESSAQTTDWTICAYEGGVCAFTGTRQVRYGANGSYVYQTLTDGTPCYNSVFGDPAPGVLKQCDTSTTSTSTPTSTSNGSWTICAYEGGVCAFTGTQQVRYGANGLYTYQTFTGGTPCYTSVFGDPAPGVLKQCDTMGGSSTSPSPTLNLPGTAVFTPSSNHATAVDSYVLDVFPVGVDPNAAYPVGTHYLGKPPISNGEIRADISSTVQTLAPGTYIATVTAVGIGGSARSAPSPPFTR